MKNNFYTLLLIAICNCFVATAVAQEYPFRTATYYYRVGTDSMLSSGLTLNSFNFSSANRLTDSIFTDGIYFPTSDCFGRNLWLRVRHVAEDPNGTNRGINVSKTGGNPCAQGGNNITLGGWAGFLYDIEIHRDVVLNGNRSYHLGSLFPTSITVSSLEWLSGTCGSSEWLSFAITNSGSTGWSLNSIKFTGSNPNSNPGFSDTMAVYTTGSCYPPDGFSYTFPTGADSISFINASATGYSEFKMSAGGVSRFQYGYEYIGGLGGYQGMSMAFGSPPTYTFTKQDPTCTNGTDGNIQVDINGGIGPFTYHWSDTANAQSGNAISHLKAGTYQLTVTDQNGCGQIADTTITLVDPNSGITANLVATNLTCFGANDGVLSVTASSADVLSYLWSNGDTSSVITQLPVGAYSCTITGQQGCYYEEAIVTQPLRADTSLSVSNATLTSHAALVTYQWVNCANNSIIANEIGSVFTPTATGSYQAILTQISTGCKDTTACVDITIANIEVATSFDLLRIFPNPTNSTITIQTDMTWQIATAMLTNLEGKVVLSQALSNSTQQTLDISHLPNGIYFVVVQSAQQKLVKRVAKM